MSNMNLNKRILRVSQVLTRLASNSKVRDNLWSQLGRDRKMNETASGGYTPSKGVFPQREMSRQFQEIKDVGLSVRPDFKLDHANDYKGSRAAFWGTFSDNKDKVAWQKAMDELSDKLKALGYQGVVDRNDIPVNEDLVKEAEGLYEEYITELGNS